MSAGTLARGLLAWAVSTVLACAVLHRAFALRIDRDHPSAVVASVWAGGKVVARAVLDSKVDRAPALDAAMQAHPGAMRVDESIVGEGLLWVRPETVFSLSLVAGHDGLAATFDGRTEYLTPDDLLSLQVYEKGIAVPGLGFATGVDVPVVFAALSERFGVSALDLIERARFRRIRTVRSPHSLQAPRVTAETMTKGDVRAAAVAAAEFLARGVDADGKFRYMVDAPGNRTLSGYDWPRHAGATYFLAQMSALTGDPAIVQAALRAANRLRERGLTDCGDHRCVGSDAVTDLGSTALCVIAFVEVARSHLDTSYASIVPSLASFLRSQQRPDGEFMHLYDRNARRPLDVQFLYFSGEASLALSRAHSLLGDPRDLEAASRSLAYLVGPAWSFFGSRYYFGEEHWTCQAMDDLWDRAPDMGALDFCTRWSAFNRKLQLGGADSPFDADGAFGLGPLLVPRLTPAGSRTEAAIATLDAMRRAGLDAREQAALDRQIRRSLALLIRHQFLPGPVHLLADAEAVRGAVPGSEVDWQLRIDYTQHMGSALVRWLSIAKSE
ncbi:MAG TPA: hypothetical protein VEK07_01275 [Polyangiaceae bacterium]|nr:hypothetical protein [Polyangiaceae bacterium]